MVVVVVVPPVLPFLLLPPCAPCPFPCSNSLVFFLLFSRGSSCHNDHLPVAGLCIARRPGLQNLRESLTHET
eukprot:8821644-Pyramimonas_sp.AAC.1